MPPETTNQENQLTKKQIQKITKDFGLSESEVDMMLELHLKRNKVIGDFMKKFM